METQERLQTFDVNYKILAFKYPSTFNEFITRSIISIFNRHDAALYCDISELQEYYGGAKEQKLKDNEYRQYSNLLSFSKIKGEAGVEEVYAKIKEKDIMLLRENLSILSRERIISSYNIIYYIDAKLKEVEKYFLYASKSRVVYDGKRESEASIINYVMDKMNTSSYPYDSLAETQVILNDLKRSYFEINTLIYSLISSSKLIVIPLVSTFDRTHDQHKEYVIPGKGYRGELRQFANNSLIPSLKKVYHNLQKTSLLKGLPISDSDITKETRSKVFEFCFFLIGLRKKSPDSISIADYNVAHLTLDCFLILENDPLSVLNSFPDLDIDNSFIAPFLSRYVQDFSAFTKYLQLMRRFIASLSQLIEREELISFFVSKGLRRKLVENFLIHLPSTVISFNLLKRQYIIAKGQIVSSIYHLSKSNYHKDTRLGRFQFEILARIFRYLEHKTKNLPLFLKEIKITPERYKEIIFILAHDSHTYTKPDKQVDKEIMSLAYLIEKEKEKEKYKSVYSLPLKTVYRAGDFKHFSLEEKQEFFKVFDLITVECVDQHEDVHEFYLKKDNLFPDDFAFLDAKPSYELMCKHFNL